MFRQYQLRTSAGRGPPSTRPSSAATSSQGSTRASSLSNSYLLPSGRTFGSTNTPATDVELEPPPSSQPRRRPGPPSDTSSQFDESISAGVRRPRSDLPDDLDSDLSQINPQRVKRLKTYAKDLCNTLEIPEKDLLEFVETGDIYRMLVNMKASLIKYDIEASANKSNALQETLASKDFETALHNRLLACVLSPNITAYVTDAQQHIMDFIFEHQDIFKIPAGVFDDSELKSSLRSTVSRLLATIRSHLKTQLTLSIVKKTYIVDVTKTLARASSGMELEVAHWNRMAFLRRCLRIFLIGTGDLKSIPLNVCFTSRLVPMLKADMRRKLESELGISSLTEEGAIASSEDAPQSSSQAVGDRTSGPSSMDEGEDADVDADLEGIPDENVDGIDDLSEEDSGFGLEGKPVRFNSSKFWNYVDYMLDLLRETARKDSSTKEEYEKGVAGIMVQIFQDDLLDCPGSSRKVARLTAANPQWQTTIQHGLMW